jgi:hypothetical protein
MLILVVGKTPLGEDRFLRVRGKHPALDGILALNPAIKVPTEQIGNRLAIRNTPTGALVIDDPWAAQDYLAGVVFDSQVPLGEYSESLGICDLCFGSMQSQDAIVEQSQEVFLVTTVAEDGISFGLSETNPALPAMNLRKSERSMMAEAETIGTIERIRERNKLAQYISGGALGLFLLGGLLLYFAKQPQEMPRGMPVTYIRNIQTDNRFAEDVLRVTSAILTQTNRGVRTALLTKKPGGFHLLIEMQQPTAQSERLALARTIANGVTTTWGSTITATPWVESGLDGFSISFGLPGRLPAMVED